MQQRRTPVSDTFVSIFVDHFHGSGPFNDKICLTVRDQFSGFVAFYDVADETAVTTTRALLSWIGIFGCPKHITSDRGPAYDSDVWRGLCSLLNMSVHYTAVRNPRANLSERPHRLLRLLCSESELSNDGDWTTTLAFAGLCWNNSRAAAVAPALAVFGKWLMDPFEIETSLTRVDTASAPEVRSIADHLEKIRNVKRQFQWDDFHESPIPPAPPLHVDDFVRDERSRIGQVIECGTWAAKVRWNSGNQSWHRFPSLRLLNPEAAEAASTIASDYAILRYDEDYYAGKILEMHDDRILVEWWDNHGTATYSPLEGHEAEWVPRASLICNIQFTPGFRISEESRSLLERLGIL